MITHLRRLALAPFFLFPVCFPYFSQIEKDRDRAIARFPRGNVMRRVQGVDMHYMRAGLPAGPVVVFVHGSPGAWDAFASFLIDDELLSRVDMFSVDRPGFGASAPGVAESSLEKQAALIAELIRPEISKRPAILVGHSFGGPVIARMAIDYPEICSSLIFVAASVDPQLEVVEWYHKVADWRISRLIIPRDLDVANQEILPLRGELEKMLPLWRRIHVPVTVIQGGQDSLVPSGNADFLAARLAHTHPTMIQIPEMDHFVPWSRPELVKRAILDALPK